MQPACLSRTASSPSPSSDTNFSTAPWPVGMRVGSVENNAFHHHNLELQLLPSPNTLPNPSLVRNDENHATQLQLSIGSCDHGEKNEQKTPPNNKNTRDQESIVIASRMREQAQEQLKLAMAEKAFAEEARQQAKRQIELAEQEFTNAKRIRQQAQAELDRAQMLKERATKQINSTIMQITCHACKQQFQSISLATAPPDENSLAVSYVSSAVTEGEGENDNRNNKSRITET